MPSPFLQRGQRPVVQHQDVDLGQLLQGGAEAAVAVGDTQLLQQAWGAQVQGAVALAAGLVAQGAGQPGFASTCLLYTSPSPRDRQKSRMPSSA